MPLWLHSFRFLASCSASEVLIPLLFSQCTFVVCSPLAWNVCLPCFLCLANSSRSSGFILSAQGNRNLFLGPRRPGLFLPSTSVYTPEWQITSLWSSSSALSPWSLLLGGLPVRITSVNICNVWLQVECSHCGTQADQKQSVSQAQNNLFPSSLWFGFVPRQVVTPFTVAFPMWLSFPSYSSFSCPISCWI